MKTESTSSTIRGSPPSSNLSFQRTEHGVEAQRRMFRRAMVLGIWIWPSFTLLDLYMCLVLYPNAPLLLFLTYRVTVQIVFVAVYIATLRPEISFKLLALMQKFAFFLAALGITLMAIHLGGLRSVYMHGISLVCLVHAVIIPSPWRRSLTVFVPIALVFPVVMGITSLLSTQERAEWFNASSLAVFAANYVFVLASSLLGMIGGHTVWAAQQQVYRARQLGRYRLQAPIGKGAMGEVWLAWDPSLRRNLALKLLRSTDHPNPGLLRRFEREARMASQLRVPHTIQIYDFGASDDGIYYIAMEYLVGTNLNEMVRSNGPLSPARAVRFAIQLCISLEEAHTAGIIHRDIKPENLFVTRVGNDPDFLKVLDFGIAHLQQMEEGTQLTLPGALAGTPPFMAPELWQGKTADVRSDIYAVGATLYFILTGVAPFEGQEMGVIREAHIEKEPLKPSVSRREPLPERLEAVVLRCLAKVPQQRFQSARELRDALTALQDLAVDVSP